MFQTLCADENCGKAGDQHKRVAGASAGVPSPRRSPTENGTKGKGTMREAFPSLPFGSPALDREGRDKDRATTKTTSHQHQQQNRDNTININSSSTSNNGITAAAIGGASGTAVTNTAITILKEDTPRLIERDSGLSAAANTDGEFYIRTIYYNIYT